MRSILRLIALVMKVALGVDSVAYLLYPVAPTNRVALPTCSRLYIIYYCTKKNWAKTSIIKKRKKNQIQNKCYHTYHQYDDANTTHEEKKKRMALTIIIKPEQ